MRRSAGLARSPPTGLATGPVAARAAAAAVAATAAGAGLWIAGHHPIAPAPALAAFGIWTTLAWRWPALWLAVLPAAVPSADFAPWTGWLVVDEFDLLALGAIAAAWCREAGRRDSAAAGARPPLPRRLALLAALLAATGLLGLARGLVGAAPSASGWFQGYTDPLNAWRVAKSLAWALLLLPPLARVVGDDPAVAVRRLSAGMLVGLASVSAAVLWERIAYPGLLDFSVRYRTVALFWEMHVGGAAIDAYLALAAPFVGWALWRARTPLQWAGAAALALLAAYACLTTFSRGVYLGVAGPLLLVACALAGQRFGFRWRPWLQRIAAGTAAGVVAGGLLAWVYEAIGGVGLAAALAVQLAASYSWHRRAALPWRTGASLVLAAALLIEAVIVLGSGSFMLTRMAATERDFGSRLAHWQRGAGLLTGDAAGWADRLVGIGLGRLPARYAAIGPAAEMSGTLQFAPPADGAAGHVRLTGAATSKAIAGMYALTQRVALLPVGAYRVTLEFRAERRARLAISVCEMHLLYERRCQGAALHVEPGDGWQQAAVWLTGPLLDAGAGPTRRLGVFALAVDGVGQGIELRRVGLTGGTRGELLRNGDFSAGLAAWFPAAQYYFLPWHIDNLYLELLIERGIAGLALFGVLIGWALRSAVVAAGPGAASFPAFLGAALAGAMTVGLVSSVMDVPRVAFLLLLFAFSSILLRSAPADRRGPPHIMPR